MLTENTAMRMKDRSQKGEHRIEEYVQCTTGLSLGTTPGSANGPTTGPALRVVEAAWCSGGEENESETRRGKRRRESWQTWGEKIENEQRDGLGVGAADAALSQGEERGERSEHDSQGWRNETKRSQDRGERKKRE